MKNIRELTVTQIRIFPSDYIPYSYLLRKEFIDHIIKKYKFQNNEMPFEHAPSNAPRVLIFSSGEYKFEGKKIIIKKLVFDERRIITEAICTSQEAKRLFNAIANDIRKFEQEKQFKASDVIFLGEETSCVVSLNIDYMGIFSDNFKSFVSDDFVNQLEHSYFEIYPKTIRFEVSFRPDEKLMKHRISLSPKQLVIEPRTEHSLEDQMFFTSTPCDTDTHLKILNSFEKCMK